MNAKKKIKFNALVLTYKLKNNLMSKYLCTKLMYNFDHDDTRKIIRIGRCKTTKMQITSFYRGICNNI